MNNNPSDHFTSNSHCSCFSLQKITHGIRVRFFREARMTSSRIPKESSVEPCLTLVPIPLREVKKKNLVQFTLKIRRVIEFFGSVNNRHMQTVQKDRSSVIGVRGVVCCADDRNMTLRDLHLNREFFRRLS